MSRDFEGRGGRVRRRGRGRRRRVVGRRKGSIPMDWFKAGWLGDVKVGRERWNVQMDLKSHVKFGAQMQQDGRAGGGDGEMRQMPRYSRP